MSGFQPADDKLSFDSFLFGYEPNDKGIFFHKKQVPNPGTHI